MKLKKLKMPSRPEIDTEELDMGMGDEMAGEGEGDSMEPSKEAAPPSDMLADVSDDELLAEIKKRGLMGQVGEEEGPAEMESEEDEYMS